MKADGKYRFNLQFSAETQEQIHVGEFLERVGNRKSAIVVEALVKYLQDHPELLGSEARIEIHTTPHYDRDELEQMVRRIVREHIQTGREDHSMSAEQVTDMDDDIAQMLDNLDLFQ